MAQKLLLSLLCVMLVVVLVFNAFGIQHAKNDFMENILTVEKELGGISSKIQKSFDVEFFTSVINLSATLLGSITEIEESLGIIEGAVNVITSAVKAVTNFIKDTSLLFDYYGRYGFKIFDNEWIKEHNFFLFCKDDVSLWIDYDTRDGFNWDKFEKYRNAYLYGEKNEYYYLLENQLNKNITDFVPNAAQNTFVFDYSLNPFSDIKFENCDYWFTTLKMPMPDDYCSFLAKTERIEKYYACVIPVFDSNFEYTYHDRECELTGFVIKTPNVAAFNGSRKYNLNLNNSYWYLDLIFTFTAPNGQLTDVHVDYYDYVSNLHGLLYPNIIQVLPYIPS